MARISRLAGLFTGSTIRFALAALLCMGSVPGYCGEKKLVAIGAPPPRAFVEAARQAGFDVVAGEGNWPPDADIACFVTPFYDDLAAQQRFAAIAAQRLKEGKTLVVAFAAQPDHANELEELLPINLWSVSGGKTQKRNLLRTGSGAIVVTDSPLASRLQTGGLRVSARYDLHLPTAAIEAGEHRYQGRAMGKDLLNTDWQTLLTSDQDGRLPLLIAGRNGPGKVLVFGANLYDPLLMTAAGYPKFVQTLLATAMPAPASITHAFGTAARNTSPPQGSPKDSLQRDSLQRNSLQRDSLQRDSLQGSLSALQGLSLRIPRYQTGPLHVEVTNARSVPAVALIAYKIRNAEYALLNSATQPVQVPAGKTLSVTVRERSPETGDPSLDASGDRALPYRVIDAGIAAPDRSHVLVEKEALVDRTEAVTLQLEGEDIRASATVNAWPDRENGRGLDIAGGAPITRTVYLTGESPTLTVVLRNGLHNVAPLATPADLGWKENPTVQGLNDMAFSYGSVRGLYPRFGAWSGRAAAEQRLELRWDAPVLLAGHRLIAQTGYRHWDRSNPTQYELIGIGANGETRLATVPQVTYQEARHHKAFAPALVSACRLHITGLNPASRGEPCAFNDVKEGKGVGSNCSLVEWETLGWPQSQPPPKVTGQLIATLTDLRTGKSRPLLQEAVALDPLAQVTKSLRLPPKADFGPVRVDVAFTTAKGDVCRNAYGLLFVEPDRKTLVPVPHSDMALLCSPGFLAFDPFGKGTTADTQGWGGPDDKIWALTHDFMEIGPKNIDLATRMFTTSTRFSHYTDPWRDFPSGVYFWDWAAEQLEQMAASGRFRNQQTLHLFLSDRWNGIPINASFTWADYIRFDQVLRQTTGHGLQGRSRQQLAHEIMTAYGDQWQKWQMNRYADKLLELQQRLAKRGLTFTVTTHGSFPLVGGELGVKISKTHKAVGTDLFWELKNEDLYGSIGTRFGLIAANPDYESGAYNEWGWCSATLNNPHWFAYSGAVEPARRQWYSTYFAGRITSEGRFEPLTKYGFHAQGGFSPKTTVNDWQNYYHTMHLTTHVRPEAPCGVGLVVSWATQEKRMGKQAGPLGFGLYAAAGQEQIDAQAGEVYQHLVKNGVPITFVASTHTLRHWNGRNPLIVVDGYGLETWECETLDRLNRAGAPIIAIGGAEGSSALAASLFGVTQRDGRFTASPGTTTVTIGERVVAYVTDGRADQQAGRQTDKQGPRAGRGPTIFCPIRTNELDGETGRRLVEAIANVLDNPVALADGVRTGQGLAGQGLVVTPFISHDHLFIALNDQGDRQRQVRIALKPARLAANYVGQKFRVIDMESVRELPARWDQDRLVFSVPMNASDGHLLLIVRDVQE